MTYIYSMDTIKLANWMTVKDYAEKHKKTIHAVYKAVERGTLTARKIGSQILIYSND